MAKEMEFKTDFQKSKEQRELHIYEEYKTLMEKPGAYSGEVTKYLMNKYKVHSPSTIWAIRKRVAQRLGENIETKEEA